MNIDYKALVVSEIEPNVFVREIKNIKTDSLPSGDVLINVKYSSLNYKDALSANGHKGITRKYPFTTGIDAAGIVVESNSSKINVGDEVIVTGFDLGMNTSGGFGQYIRVPAEWVVPLPKNLTLQESMMYGTAGFTVGVCINELIRHDITPDKGKILVTGATGGVGSLAVAMLSKIGYEVTASTGKSDSYDFLKQLGASEIISREEVIDKSGKPMLAGKWAGMIDNVGGDALTSSIKSIKQRGCVCILGNVSSDKFESTVYPFLLRGISLAGIDSASRLMDERLGIWDKISTIWKIENMNLIIREVGLDSLSFEIDKILRGGQKGRVLVRLD